MSDCGIRGPFFSEDKIARSFEQALKDAVLLGRSPGTSKQLNPRTRQAIREICWEFPNVTPESAQKAKDAYRTFLEWWEAVE